MKYVIQSQISGDIIAPKSKSIIQRKLIADFFADNLLDLDLSNNSDDVNITYKALKNIKSNSVEINLGQSGFCYRVIPVIASIYNNNNSFLIDNSLSRRPNLQLLSSIGLNSEISKYSEEYSVLKVENNLVPGKYIVDCSITSQILSGLLMTLSILKGDSKIKVFNLESKPYIDLTLDILSTYSIDIINIDYREFIIKGNQKYKKIADYEETDWSGASFIIAAATINSEKGVEISGLNPKSVQADKEILNILDKSNVEYKFTDNKLFVKKSVIQAFEHNFSDCPDLLPAVIPLAINSEGICSMKNISRLKYKESNRVISQIDEYKKCGIKIEISGDDMIIYPGKFIGSEINSHNDHRIAMSLAVSGLNSSKSLIIKDSDCVNKSYPDFWKHLISLGANIK
jgi:3-phosphoshikimate 1-carboxyvinyltransferase